MSEGWQGAEEEARALATFFALPRTVENTIRATLTRARDAGRSENILRIAELEDQIRWLRGRTVAR